ncbi:MAG: tetratricopeptide repeat protein [Candidatus Kariarchaeaceae archaeon]|jgi:tetratricopeptide (TPR) repeat protein
MGIHEIKSLMEKGEYDEVLMKIDQSEDNELDLKILKSMALRYKELFNASLTMAFEALSDSKNFQSKIHELAAMTQVAYGLLITHKIGQSQEYLSKIENIWNTLTDEQKENAREWESYKYHIKAGIYFVLGDFDKSIYYDKKNLELREQINDRFGLLSTLNNLGASYSNKGEYDRAFECAKQQLSLSEKLGNRYTLAYAYERLGSHYTIIGEYDQARKNFNKQLEICNELNLRVHCATATSSMGRIHYREGEYEQAIKNFSKSLSIYEDLNFEIYVAKRLYYLILVNLKLGSAKSANNYLRKLMQIAEKNPNERIKVIKNLSHAIILKNNPRSKYKAEAQTILEEIIKENKIFRISLDAALHLSELLLDELQMYGSDEVLEEVEKLTRNIYEMAQEHQLYPLIVEVLILRAKLEFINLKMDETDKLLQQAHLIAEERGLDRLLNSVEQEENRMALEIKLASEISKSGSTIQERFDKSQVIEYILAMQDQIGSE